jgi:hypothetical protein
VSFVHGFPLLFEGGPASIAGSGSSQHALLVPIP